MPPTTDDKPSTAFEAFFYRYIFPRLPHDAQAIYMEPPTFAKPISFLPLFRLLIPYIGYIITLIAFIIVWSFMTSIIGYFSRVLRFSLRVIPIIAFALWIMGSSDQASTQELFAVVKEWAGFESEKHAGSDESTMGGLFGLKQNTEKKRAKPRTRSGSSSSPRARSKAGADHAKTTDLDLQKGINLVSSWLNSAVGNNQDETQTGQWQTIVQDYVKKSVMRASGLDWLLGKQPVKEEKKSRIWGVR
nr:hypothetical protein L204_05350 [Cryptococcus depauperatus CBS 7855]